MAAATASKQQMDHSMKTINPTSETLARLRALPQDKPIVMVNLLRYRRQADYPANAEFSPCTGREAYRRYSKTALEKISAVGGDVVWMGQAQASVIAPAGEQWDDVILVRYPTPAAFLQMVSMADYQAATVHRTAALDDARLIATSQAQSA
jgi:uncharacterized protein (DUF1330 family)